MGRVKPWRQQYLPPSQAELQRLEQGWNARAAPHEWFIPEWDVTRSRIDNGRLAQLEPHVRRPTTAPDFPGSRLNCRKVPSLMFVDSMAGNRRNYEPDAPYWVVRRRSAQRTALCLASSRAVR